jgi:hypothetical protein
MWRGSGARPAPPPDADMRPIDLIGHSFSG